jgi:hypothetical protein
LKIKKSSWHYKIRNFGNDWTIENDTLCRYFWAFIFKCIMIIVGTGFFVSIVYAFFDSPFTAAITIMSLFIISIFGVPILFITWMRRKYGQPIELPKEHLVLKYIKAKKHKICPLIEYID